MAGGLFILMLMMYFVMCNFFKICFLVKKKIFFAHHFFFNEKYHDFNFFDTHVKKSILRKKVANIKLKATLFFQFDTSIINLIKIFIHLKFVTYCV